MSKGMFRPVRQSLFCAALLWGLWLPLGGRAQEHVRDCNRAIDAVQEGKVDSAFYYLNRWSEEYGDRFARYLFSILYTHSELRPLHGDARWGIFIEKIRRQKRAEEERYEISYPRRAEVAAAADAPRVVGYDLAARIGVERRRVEVEGIVEVDFRGRDSLNLILWHKAAIRKMRSRGREVAFRFDTAGVSPSYYIPDGRPLTLYNPQPGSGRHRMAVGYTLDMSGVQGWGRSFDEEWIEIGYYTAWYPVCDGEQADGATVEVTIDDGYRVSGSGIVTRAGGKWRMEQPWRSFDLVILAAPDLKSRRAKEGATTVEVVYTDFATADADSVLRRSREVMAFYRRLYKTRSEGEEYLKFAVSSSNDSGGYSRKNYISYNATRFGERFIRGIAHEAAHLWWNKASTLTWHDWLNEAFAEFSMLWYLRATFGEAVYNERIEAYRENTRRHCPIWEVDRAAPEAYTALYEKGALLLHDLLGRLGEERFFGLLSALLKTEVSDTPAFLDFAERELGRGEREWIERRLKE